MKTPIKFQRGNESGTQITLTAIGDIMMQEKTQIAAQNAIDESISHLETRIASGFQSIFEPIRPDLTRGDLLVGNLETPIAANLIPTHQIAENNQYICEQKEIKCGILYDGHVYGATKYPKRRRRFNLPNFNTHPSLAVALKNIGFDLLFTANNHVMDRGHNGIDLSIDALRSAGIDFVGTLRSNEVIGKNPDFYPNNCPYIIKNVQGIRIAFFSFTNFINQEFIKFQDKSNQIYTLPRKKQPQQKEWLLKSIRSAKTNPEIDLIILSVHWGIDYIGMVFKSQRKNAYEILDAGADIILGHHSHVLQPAEKYTTKDGRETFVIYGLGNFTTDMPGIRSQTTIILYLGITKNDSDTFLSGMQYLPVARHIEGENDIANTRIQNVAIDRFPQKEFSRHRKRVVKIFGPGNLKKPDTEINYPTP